MKGFGVPHSVYYSPGTNELLVIDGEKPSPVLNASTLKVKRDLQSSERRRLIGLR